MSERIGNYQVVSYIGAGGMGEVYKVRDQHGREFALKRIRPDHANRVDILARFQREADLLRRLDHPNLVSVIDAGQYRDSVYFVMPFIPGQSLSERLKSGKPLSVQQGRIVVHDIGAALQFAHDRQIIHRDIKPGNILLHPSGIAYLTDFGIAAVPQHLDQALTMTSHHAMMGTPLYMAPEVEINGRRADACSDIYSFGLTIYEMLTAKRYKEALLTEDDPWQSIPEVLHTVLKTAVQTNPSKRYHTVRQFVQDFERVTDNQAMPRANNTPIMHSTTRSSNPGVFATSPATNRSHSPAPPSLPRDKTGLVFGIVFGMIALIVLIIIVTLLSNDDNNIFEVTLSPTTVQRSGNMIVTPPPQQPTPTFQFDAPTPITRITRVPDTGIATSVSQNRPRPDLPNWGRGTILTTNRGTNLVSEGNRDLSIDAGQVVIALGTYFYDPQRIDYWWDVTTLSGFSGAIQQSHMNSEQMDNTPYLEPWSAQTRLRVGYETAFKDSPGQQSAEIAILQEDTILIATGYFYLVPTTQRWWWQVTDGRQIGWIVQDALTSNTG